MHVGSARRDGDRLGRLLVGRQPQAERHPALLPGQRVPRPPQERPEHRVRRGRLPPQPGPARRRPERGGGPGEQRPGDRPGLRRRRHRHGRLRRLPRPGPSQQRELPHAARRPARADADVPVAAHSERPVRRLRRGERRVGRLPRVRARALEPARHRRRRLRRAQQRAGGGARRGAERLLRDGLPRRPGSPDRRLRRPTCASACISTTASPAACATSRWTASRCRRTRRLRASAPTAARPTPPPSGSAGSPSPTSATSTPGPRCTATARSGRRPCGRSGAPWSPRTPPTGSGAHAGTSPRACASRRPSRRSWTCATRSSRRASPGATRTSCGRCSPSAAWATSPGPPTAPTSRRSRTSPTPPP